MPNIGDRCMICSTCWGRPDVAEPEEVVVGSGDEPEVLQEKILNPMLMIKDKSQTDTPRTSQVEQEVS